MAGIKFLTKTPQNINYIINQLIRPEIKQKLFDDYCGLSEISLLMYSPSTVIYGIFAKGRPEPVGVVFFTGVIPYRDCSIYAVIFDKENRKQGLVSSQVKTIERDMWFRFFVNSATAYTIGRNPASEKILTNLGFEKIGTKKRGIMSNGEYKDLHIFYRLVEDPRKAKEEEEIKEG